MTPMGTRSPRPEPEGLTRVATAEDANLLARCCPEWFRSPGGPHGLDENQVLPAPGRRANLVLVVAGSSGELLAILRARYIDDPGALPPLLGCASVACLDAALPAFFLDLAATAPAHRNRGLNGLLRWHLVRLARQHPVASLLGVIPVEPSPPRLGTLRSLGYSLSPRRSAKYVRRPRDVWVAHLDLARHGETALRQLEVRTRDLRSRYPWQGPPPGLPPAWVPRPEGPKQDGGRPRRVRWSSCVESLLACGLDGTRLHPVVNFSGMHSARDPDHGFVHFPSWVLNPMASWEEGGDLRREVLAAARRRLREVLPLKFVQAFEDRHLSECSLESIGQKAGSYKGSVHRWVKRVQAVIEADPVIKALSRVLWDG